MRSEGKTVFLEDSYSGKIAVGIKEAPHSTVQDREVRIRGLFSSITFKDFLVGVGRKSLGALENRGIGTDYVGVIHESKSDTFQVGDAVWVVGTSLGSGSTGGLSEFLILHESLARPLPSGWSPLVAASGGTPLLTASLAWLKILRALGSKPNSIAISGVGGSVGGFALEIARQNNPDRIYAISSRSSLEFRRQSDGRMDFLSPESLSRGSKFGLLPERWDCGIDVLGGTALNGMLKAARPKGIVVALGMVFGDAATINLAPFFLRSVTLSGLNLEAEIAEEYREVCDIADSVVHSLQMSQKVFATQKSEIEDVLSSRGDGTGPGRAVFDLSSLEEDENQ